LKLKLKRGESFKDAAFMGIMRWAVYNRLKELYPNVSLTYGYITKNTRIRAGLGKTHATDAYCIAGNIGGARTDTWHRQKFVRRSNRSLHKANLLKGGIRKSNKAAYIVHGYRLFDKVKFDGQECFVFGRRASGYFDLRMLDGTKVHASASHKKIRLAEYANSLLSERRMAIPPPPWGSGFIAKVNI
jgi:N6-L-threonylcarbamoyladenine synthase